jgi:integrase/recombinase XerD
MLTLLARLGLRSIEVARLELDDIDWRAGEIRIRGKARRTDRMPLPVEVGDAVSAYLIDGRPPIRDRHVFLTLRFFGIRTWPRPPCMPRSTSPRCSAEP